MRLRADTVDVDFSNSVPNAQITDQMLPIGSLSGRRVGPYLLQSELGRGGMGSVWLARRDDGQYDAQVAIKLLATAWLGRDGEIRFRHEGMLLARLDHPNIARLLDAGVTEQGEPYLVLEYIEGERVDDYCRKVGLQVRTRIELFLELLSAVAHAHRNLIVHRDIKPANVLVTREGKAKLLDFGIGKLVQGEEALTRTGHAVLTPEYAAPEQLLGEPVTTATDVYALGLLLYVILTERHPYLDAMGSPAELLRRITTGAMPLPSSIAMTQLRAGAPPVAHKSLQRELRGDLDNIVLKAMHSAPEQRYQDVGAFAADHHVVLAAQVRTPQSRGGDVELHLAAGGDGSDRHHDHSDPGSAPPACRGAPAGAHCPAVHRLPELRAVPRGGAGSPGAEHGRTGRARRGNARRSVRRRSGLCSHAADSAGRTDFHVGRDHHTGALAAAGLRAQHQGR